MRVYELAIDDSARRQLFVEPSDDYRPDDYVVWVVQHETGTRTAGVFRRQVDAIACAEQLCRAERDPSGWEVHGYALR